MNVRSVCSRCKTHYLNTFGYPVQNEHDCKAGFFFKLLEISCLNCLLPKILLNICILLSVFKFVHQ